jgi:hypothetical protein
VRLVADRWQTSEGVMLGQKRLRPILQFRGIEPLDLQRALQNVPRFEQRLTGVQASPDKYFPKKFPQNRCRSS